MGVRTGGLRRLRRAGSNARKLRLRAGKGGLRRLRRAGSNARKLRLRAGKGKAQ